MIIGSRMINALTDVCRKLNEPNDECLDIENDEVSGSEETSINERVFGTIQLVQRKDDNNCHQANDGRSNGMGRAPTIALVTTPGKTAKE
jgi:hypothetical protein